MAPGGLPKDPTLPPGMFVWQWVLVTPKGVLLNQSPPPIRMSVVRASPFSHHFPS